MQYQDLIQFEPLETVVKLVQADQSSEARRLVETFVFSDEMAQRIEDIALPQLQFKTPHDNMGLFVVGNYGTGKSHLMAVLSAVGQDASLQEHVRHPALKKAFGQIAGQFQVIRTEIGASEMSLRDIIVKLLEQELKKRKVKYKFPAADTLINHLGAFEDMMAAFTKAYPEQGLLLIIDELLDYLRGRSDQNLIRDINFLREVGEACKNLPFRFMCGIQESLFESPSFKFASESIKKIKDRFTQVIIARSDVRFVVSERLLAKTDTQKQKIQNHLERFARFFGSMAEQLPEYVQLFPIHPDYISTFSDLTLLDKRHILRTLTQTMNGLKNKQVPEDQPGLVAFDHFWHMLREDATFKSMPEVQEVLTCSRQLEERIRNSFTRPMYKPMALRIIHALSVHRLSTGDIHKPLGLTATELRDRLCLFDTEAAEMFAEDDAPADEMLMQVQVVLQEILKTVSGQFIGHSTENGQYWLDLKRTIDYDMQIQERAESLDDSSLDRAYFDVLQVLLECQDSTLAATGFKIWQHELEWLSHKAGRRGYLFFGAPNERSTAQPPRDFYLYFLQAFEPPVFSDTKSPDEVFFRLEHPDETFKQELRLFAAARELDARASGQASRVYRAKASERQQTLIEWLYRHLQSAFTIKYQGKTRQFPELVRGQLNMSHGEPLNPLDLINTAAAVCLENEFAAEAPEYPVFASSMTQHNRAAGVQDALRALAGATPTRQAIQILDAFHILQGDTWVYDAHPYAQWLRKELQQRGSGQVLNRSQLFQSLEGVEFFHAHRFRLEPAWAVLLCGALVAGGHAVLVIKGRKFGIQDLKALADTPLHDLQDFRHLEAPRDWDIPALRALFEALDLPEVDVQEITQNQDAPIVRLQDQANRWVNEVVTVQHRLQEGLHFWGRSLLNRAELSALQQSLTQAKHFLEDLQVYQSAARLKNLKYSANEIQQIAPHLNALPQTQAMLRFTESLSADTSWLQQAEDKLPLDHDWHKSLKSVRDAFFSALSPDYFVAAQRAEQWLGQIRPLKSAWIEAYLALHAKARLDLQGQEQLARLRQDPRLKQLRDLSSIDLMPVSQFKQFQNALGQLKTCSQLTASNLQSNPTCPHCLFNPLAEQIPVAAIERLNQLETQLQGLLDNWLKTLQDNLADPATQESIALLDASQQSTLEEFNTAGVVEIDETFLNASRAALEGLVRVSVSATEVQKALLEGGLPAGPQELKARFTRLIDRKTRGHDPERVRVVIEEQV